jgi:hypothetical protein
MGTRSTIHIVDHSDEMPVTLARLYIQYDGYPTGVGRQIQEILGGKSVVNGYNDADTQINGPGCMGAMLIDGLKEGCGGVYLTPPAQVSSEEYDYTVTCKGAGNPIHLHVIGHGEELYDGTLNDFNPEKCENEEYED